MMQYRKLQHRFVDHFPDALEGGILYVSLEYGSVAHSCCCGCGEEIITPLTPTDWRITYNGDSITLSPSVGNWTLACRSHYVIDRGRVIEALPWSEEDIENERFRDRRAKQVYYGQGKPLQPAVNAPVEVEAKETCLAAGAEMPKTWGQLVLKKLKFWARD